MRSWPRSSTLAASVSLPGRALFAAPAAEHSVDALRQEPLRERLSDEIVSAYPEANYFVKFFVFGGEEDHWQVGLFAEAPQGLHSIHARHLDVQDGGFELKPTWAGEPSA
jgi:hypothetical protein